MVSRRGVDALAPVVVTCSEQLPMQPDHDEINDLDDLLDELGESMLSDSLRQQASVA